jgi:ArsR family transcriptional regulator
MAINNKTKILQTILEPNRTRILEYLHKSDSCVCEMVRDLKIKHNLLSHHLSTLVKNGLLSNKRKGRHSIYRINNDKIDCVNKILDFTKKYNTNCT